MDREQEQKMSGMTRRELLRIGLAGAGVALTAPDARAARNPYGPFRMGVQSYSLRHFPMPEMLQKVRDLGLKEIEAYNGHFAVTDDPARLAEYRAALKKAGVKLYAFGVEGFGKDRAANRRLFTFAKAMGIKTLSADPAPESFDQLEELVREFNINIAIHNHGPGSRYDAQESVYRAVEGRDRRIGACVDTGHFMRSNADPVEVVRRLGNRVHGVHLKDVRTVEGRKEFTEVGKGDLDTVELLRSLKAAKFKGVLALEYEEHPQDPLPYMRECLDATRAAAGKL